MCCSHSKQGTEQPHFILHLLPDAVPELLTGCLGDPNSPCWVPSAPGSSSAKGCSKHRSCLSAPRWPLSPGAGPQLQGQDRGG